MNELALFAGCGGGVLASHLLGHRIVCAVEIDEYARRILMQRQDDGVLQPFPIWDDITTFDGRPWRGHVDVISGGFPCQDISAAGKGAGIEGSRSGLWQEMARVVREVRPRYVFVENSPMLVSRGLAVVLGDLAEMGFDAVWGCIRAADIGFAHRRDRVWALAYARGDLPRFGMEAGDSGKEGCQWPKTEALELSRSVTPLLAQSWQQSGQGVTAESGLPGLAHGVPDLLDRIRCSGNGQVPAVAAFAWALLAQIAEDVTKGH